MIDKLLYRLNHYEKAWEIIEQVNTSHRVITIGGSSGTGKTEIATIMGVALGYNVMSLDKYYIIPPKLRGEWRKNNFNKIGIEEINWKYLMNDFLKIGDKIIIEGLYANYFKIGDLAIHIKGTVKDTYEFRKARLKENPDCRFRKKVVAKEFKEVEKLIELADIII